MVGTSAHPAGQEAGPDAARMKESRRVGTCAHHDGRMVGPSAHPTKKESDSRCNSN
jgi:hypothetical protein